MVIRGGGNDENLTHVCVKPSNDKKISKFFFKIDSSNHSSHKGGKEGLGFIENLKNTEHICIFNDYVFRTLHK